MKILKRMISKIIPRSLIKAYRDFCSRERRIKLGNANPDKIFYVIGYNDPVGGLWWLVNKALMHIGYAESKGYIPVVDYQNNITQYTDEKEIGKVNFWEKIFKQPTEFSLDDIKKSKNVILAKKAECPNEAYFMGHFYNDEKKICYFRELFHKYIKFNDRVNIDFANRLSNLFGENKVVGVLCRGTDYMIFKPQNHPVQPEPEMVIQKVTEVMKKYNCNKVFLATEDADILDVFKKNFGTNLLYIDQIRLSKKEMISKQWLAFEKNKLYPKRDKLSEAVDYLFAIYALSKCNCFISGRTGGAKGVLMMTKGFQYQYIYDLGLYK